MYHIAMAPRVVVYRSSPYQWSTYDGSHIDGPYTIQYRIIADHVRRSGCHEMLIENDTDGPHSDDPHDGPHTVQYRIVAY